MENNIFENQPQEQPVEEVTAFEQPVQEEPAVEGTVIDKVKKIPVKLIAIAGAAIVAIIALILVIGALTNTYKAPVKAMVNLRNSKSYTQYEKLTISQFNGLCENEMKAIYKLRQKSEDFDKSEEKEDFKDEIDTMKEEYGNNYKYSVKIDDKEKIDKDDLKDTQEQLRDMAKDTLEELKDLDSDDIEEIAEDYGISKANCKKLIKEMKSIGQTMKKVKISAGYELDVTVTLKGSELDEPEEYETSITVYKVNGRWVSTSQLFTLAYAGF